MKEEEKIIVGADESPINLEKTNAEKIEDMRAQMQHKLTRLEFNMTERCNANCSFCANDLDLLKTAKGEVISIEKIIELLDRVKPEIVNFTGGEPTLVREVLRRAIREATQRGIVVQLDTNALFLETEEIDQLVGDGVKRFHISYSTTKQRFSQSRGVTERHFDTLERNISYIAAIPNIQCLCECILHRGNFQDIPEIYKKCCELGVDEFQIQPLMPVGKADLSMVLPPRQLASTIRGVFDMEDSDTPIKVWCSYVTQCSPHGNSVFVSREKPKQSKIEVPKGITGMDAGCQEGWTRLHIHNNGDILICDITKLVGPLGNVYRDDILDIYENHPLLRQIRETQPKDCECCREWDNCHNVCPILALDINESSPPKFSDWLEKNVK